jgi:F420-dependent oxidoreductase-like protein
MRFAFKTANQGTTWTEILALWQEADRIELFESGWLFDHFYPIWSPGGPGDPTGPCLEGWTMLAALAQATRRLRLGTLVTGIPYRHPAVLANMAATVDILSGGRLELGIGAGWNEEESGAYGLALGSPRERSDRFEEACEVLVGLLSQPTANFDGRYYQLTDARCEPKGPQVPHPPIVIGGNGEKRTLRTAARFAQHWNFVGGPTEEFARKRDILHAHCRDIGRDTREITLSSHVWLASGSKEDLGRLVDQVAALGREGLDLAIIYLMPPFEPSVLAPLAEALGPLR